MNYVDRKICLRARSLSISILISINNDLSVTNINIIGKTLN